MDAICSNETSSDFQRTTRRHISDVAFSVLVQKSVTLPVRFAPQGM
jgi:hypothetical protein